MFRTTLVISTGLALSSSLAAQCATDWTDRFPSNSIDGVVQALTLFDDGSGTALAFGGKFEEVAGLRNAPGFQGGVAAWSEADGFELFGAGFDVVAEVKGVRSLAAFDSGAGEGLYAAGRFELTDATPIEGLARWDGASWLEVGGGLARLNGTSPIVNATLVYDAGSGDELYVAGRFDLAGGLPARNVATWNGTSWTALASSMDAPIEALAIFDDGSGPALYAGGSFTTIDGQPAAGIAKLDGATWLPLGAGVNGVVHTLAVHDDGTGAALHAGGIFTTAGGASARRVAKWNGSAWSALGTGVGAAPSGSTTVRALASFDGELYAGGNFGVAGSTNAQYLARWDGADWQSAGTELDGEVYALLPATEGASNVLYASGDFLHDGPDRRPRLARLEAAAWSSVGVDEGADEQHSGFGGLPIVLATEVFDDGSGPTLYVGGDFNYIGGVPATSLARRVGDTWDTSFGTLTDAPLFISLASATLNRGVSDMEIYDDGLGGGPALYVGGRFASVNGIPANGIARWDGTTWTALPPAIEFQRGVSALAVYNDPVIGKEVLVVAGDAFPDSGQITSWDGTTWRPLGVGIGPTGVSQRINVMLAAPDPAGDGDVLFVGGRFSSMGGNPNIREFAWWDGSQWHGILGRFSGPEEIMGIESFDDPTTPGSDIFIGERSFGGGAFFDAFSWDGTTLRDIEPPFLSPEVRETGVFDDGSGPLLYLALGATSIYTYDGTDFTLFDGNTRGAIYDLEPSPHPDTGAPALLVGGALQQAGGEHTSGIAILSVSCTYESYCSGDGGLAPGCTPCPCGNDAPAGTIGGCLNGQGASARLDAAGVASVSLDSLRFTVNGMPPATSGTLFSADNALPNNAASPCFGLGSGIANAGDGLRCIGGNLGRHGARASNAAGAIGATTPGWGGNDGPPQGLAAQGGFVAGQTRRFQVFHRADISATCGTGINTTQGMSVQFTP